MDLANKKCEPCEGTGKPLDKTRAENYLIGLPDWKLSEDGKEIRAAYNMKNFVAAVRLVEKIAEIAEKENHHPDFHLTGYRKLAIHLSTHAIGGLSKNDFILAAKIESLPKELKS